MRKILYFILALFFCLVSFSSVSFAEETVPSYSDLIDKHGVPQATHISQVVSSGKYNLFLFYDYNNFIEYSNAKFVTGINDSDSVYVNLIQEDGTKSLYNVVRYRWDSTNGWELKDDFKSIDNITIGTAVDGGLNNLTIISSDFDIIGKNNELLFPEAPTLELYQKIQELTNQEMTKTQMTVVGAMKVLVLCGVGLIALLVVLNLFGKVFRLFQVR